MNDGLTERQKLLLKLSNDRGRYIVIDCEHIEYCGTPLYVGECIPECLRRRNARYRIKNEVLNESDR